jgi:hypothetical protein
MGHRDLKNVPILSAPCLKTLFQRAFRSSNPRPPQLEKAEIKKSSHDMNKHLRS